MRTAPAVRGFTMIEMMVAIIVSSIVLAAAMMLLRNNQRFYRSQSQIVDVQQNMRAVVEMLPSELRELSSSGGDILAMTDTSLQIRPARGLGFLCDAPDVGNGRIVIRNAMWYGYRTIDATRDGIYIFADADSTSSSDDTWVHADITGAQNEDCADGTSGTEVRLANVTGGFAALGDVVTGAPVRTHETVTYRLYNDGSGKWWLGVSQLVSGAWTSTSEVAGPLRASDGLDFDYYNSSGAATTALDSVAWIGMTVRGVSNQPIFVQGRPQGTYADSLSVRVALRGN